MNETAVSCGRLDPVSAGWLSALTGTGAEREAALARLHHQSERSQQN
jgi:hypothetical protein